MIPEIIKLREYIANASKKPRVDCTGCWECCCDEVPMCEEEREVLATHSELWGKGKGYCRWLDKQGRCSVYEDRPIICRAFGTIKTGDQYCDKNKNNLYPPNQLMADYRTNKIGTWNIDYDSWEKQAREILKDRPEDLAKVLQALDNKRLTK